MAVILKNGAVFLHIPKTAGNWVRETLAEAGLVAADLTPKHITLNKLYSRETLIRFQSTRLLKCKNWFRGGRVRAVMYASNLKRPFVFTFVRDPVAWYESWFSYMSRPDRKWREWGRTENGSVEWHPCAPLNGLGSKDFGQFVGNVIEKRPGFVTELYSWYTGTGIDFIGKQENLVQDLIHVINIMGESVDKDFIYSRSKLKANSSGNYKENVKWDPDLKKRVEFYEAVALKKYGYNLTKP